MKKKRINLVVDEQTYRSLIKLAMEGQTSIAQIIRWSIKHYLAK